MTATQHSVREELFGPRRRAVTVGMLLLISLIAFEMMGVGTAMPSIVADLGSLATYAWPFVAFTAATVVGTVLGGRWSDAHGPRLMLIGAPAVFGVGLLVAGTAGSMGQLLIGRVLQGLGAGAQGVAVYVLIAIVYTEPARPAVFGLISSAWVLPSLVGPPVAGLVTERFSWHWVFLGLVPLVVLAVLLVLPAVRGLTPPPEPRPARRGLVPAALAAAAAVAGLSWAGQQPTAAGAITGAVAIAVGLPALTRIIPRGTLRADRGVAAVVAGRGLLSGSFFTVTAYLPLMLTTTHRWSLTAAGLPLLVGSLGWSVASAWQGRHPRMSRPRLLRVGFLLVAVGATGMVAVAPAWGPAWPAIPLWGLAGVGMGLGFSALSFLLMRESAAEEIGFNSSAAQLGDQLSQAVLVGVGGAALVLLATPAAALPVLFAGLALLAYLGAALSGRTG